MPELPEVETVRRGLDKLIVGRTITSVVVRDSPKSFPNDVHTVDTFMIGSKVSLVRRRAKVLLIDLDSAYTLVVHLKMTGQLVFVDDGQGGRFGAGHPNDSLIGKLPDRSTRVVIEFSDGSHLYFNDQRKFGWIKLFADVEVPNIDFMKRVGPEPLEDGFTGEVLYERLQRRRRTTIKAAILDQSVLAGVGNIYADEALWGAKIHPATLVGDVSRQKVKLLTDEIKYVMNLSIEKGGSTDRNYVNAEGQRGSYIDFARVFRREGQACQRHADVLIEKIRVAGRGTHICPKCQPTPRVYP
jgi:formamidopyrimidine-DNA glycosylase